jgi:hypothetical protein
MLRYRHSLTILAILLLTVASGAASYVLQDVQVRPAGIEVQQHTPVNVLATAQIIPQGPTTYIEGYTMVLSTGLDQATWKVRVLVDGRPAAVFDKSGPTVFISGYLLSYPTYRDVAVAVSLDGNAPSGTPGSSFTILQIIELNNQGQVVSGSEQLVSKSLAPASSTPSATVIPSKTPIPETSAKAMIPLPAVIGGVVLLVLFLNAGRSR